jgi:hypothetical protein
MNRFLIALFVASCGAVLSGADYALPAERSYPWEAGVTAGVPGGIDQYISARTTLIDVTQSPYNADNTGATNATTAVQSAVNAATSGQVVYLPAGTYRFNSQVSLGGTRDNITVRGAGPTQTIINFYGASGSAFKIGTDQDYLWNSPQLAITGSPSRLVSTVSAASTSAVTVGAIGHIELQNSTTAALPILSVSGYNYQRYHKLRVASKTATTITFDNPIAFDLPSGLSPRWVQAGAQTEFAGVESLAIDGTNSTTPHSLLAMEQAYACWFYNVKVTTTPNYNIGVFHSVNCEVRKSLGVGRKTEGTNGAGLLFSSNGNCLIEDNIFGENFPSIEVNTGATANVFAYNFCYKSSVFGGAGVSINTNHNPHNSHNLYEGNIAPNVQCDGYFGSASHDVFYRNWLHGVNSLSDTSIRGLTANFNRFTRYYTMVGNVLGANLSPGYIYPTTSGAEWGMPGMGSWSWTGTAEPSTGDWWADWGTSPGSNGFQELDLDVENTLLLKGNYNTDDDAIPAGESLGSDTLPASLYRDSKPAHFGSLTWPAINPTSPTTVTWGDAGFEQIPAGYRYVNGEEPPAGEGDTTAPTISITSPTSSPTMSTSTSPLTISGSASDAVGVTSVTWANSAGGSGTATGTTSWSFSASLTEGSNVVTVTAHDAAGNTGTDTLTITYTPPSLTPGTASVTTLNVGTLDATP